MSYINGVHITDDHITVAKSTIDALEKAEPLVQRFIENYTKRCSKNGDSLVGADMMGLQMALMQGSLKIFLMLEKHGLADEKTKTAARMGFAGTAIATFEHFVDTYDVYDENNKMK